MDFKWKRSDDNGREEKRYRCWREIWNLKNNKLNGGKRKGSCSNLLGNEGDDRNLRKNSSNEWGRISRRSGRRGRKEGKNNERNNEKKGKRVMRENVIKRGKKRRVGRYIKKNMSE